MSGGVPPLARLLAERIAATGPIPVAEFMATCLWHPAHGYYATRDPLGASGDFVTAPEISQMFGELLGLALAQAWIDQGSPPRIVLAELGPGRGTLMADLLRAAARVPGFVAAAELHLVEASPVLAEAQRRAVPGAAIHPRTEDLPEGPLYLVANEFFDALPIRQFVREGEGEGGTWRERMVGLEGDALAFGLSPAAPVEALSGVRVATGGLVETCAPGAAIAAEIGRRLAAQGGAALIVDYGDWGSEGDTLQALSGGARIDPLARPGESDLTAHVDFEALARAAAPALPTRLTPQGVFLERLGITQRAQALARGLSGPALEAHVAAHRRLTHPEEMGLLFKVMGLTHPDAPPPPGLVR
ncbi:class I SAM-dependent methyltransferase [Wenxinia saemankumensis]|uniref:SAM-dependent methyltransferase, MidA family n=1 Tax=Wenxinia saemankumensis TaxID=1447782 RepID=A0A1M6BX05_9RHOB|nr:SAM-dependent methyltransferase [Wenxinia saemankumensis]SHI53295.1 SAM-dependent methyltransferase, MidA family [Wenxinia saemankumensis]